MKAPRRGDLKGRTYVGVTSVRAAIVVGLRDLELTGPAAPIAVGFALDRASSVTWAAEAASGFPPVGKLAAPPRGDFDTLSWRQSDELSWPHLRA